jgi:hypothetical protein
MNPDDRSKTVRVTLEDLGALPASEPAAVLPAPTGQKSYGNINAATEAPLLQHEKGSILLQGWFYLGVAGLLGALAGWAIAEPGFVDDGGMRWGNVWMLPSMITLMCVGFAMAESLVERSAKKALLRGSLALLLGIALGFGFDFGANVIYRIGLSVVFQMGVRSHHNPSVWVVRGLAWIVFGAAGGVVYGIIGQSSKKTAYGVLGGAIGACLGGVIFDPISFVTHGGATSRVVGFCLFGLTTGIAMGLVESALKDRWLYVTSGPLAGKQFILYKPQTTLGSSQTCDIYLFKDSEIKAHHATLLLKGSRLHLQNDGPVYVAGQPVRGTRVLESGNVIQLGRYSFRYQERQRK